MAVPTNRSATRSVNAGGAELTGDERVAALAFLQQLAGEVSKGTVDLPCFPGVVVRISAALADPDTTSEQIVTIVSAEPRLAARLLQTANSAAFNTSGKAVSELRSAVTRIGQRIVRSTAMSYAMQQMQNEESLASISSSLSELWNRSIAVASICQLVAERTKVHTDEAFLTGLLHGIGNLYIMAHAARQTSAFANPHSWTDLLEGWHTGIGKAVLESWKFPEEICNAVGDQRDYERRWRHDATLTDVLIVGIILADVMQMPEPRKVPMEGVNSFATVGLNATDCEATMVRAERRIAVICDALK